MRNRFKRQKGKMGFTLIEILVAIAILALLAVPLAQTMITSAQINSQSKNVGSASDMAQTVAESMQATKLGDVLTEVNGYHTNSVGYDLFNEATGEGYSFLNNALKGYSVEDKYEVMLTCPGCNSRLSNEEVENNLCDNPDCGQALTAENIKYVPVRRQNDPGVQSDADVSSSIKTRTTKDNVVRTYFTGNTDDTYDFILKNIHTEEASFDVLVHVEPEQTLKIADISSMSSSNLVNIVEKKNLDEDVAETFYQSHQMYSSLRHTNPTKSIDDFKEEMIRNITIDIMNDAVRGTTVITIKAVYTAPDGTVDVADKYITKTIGSFTTNSTAELADGVYFYFYPLRGVGRDVITVNNPSSMSLKVYLIQMNDEQVGTYNPVLKFSDLTPSNASKTTTFCSNMPQEQFAELPTGVNIKTLSNTTEQQTLYSMDVKVFTHKDGSFAADGTFAPDDKYLLVDTNATLLDSSERFDINVDTEFGNPIPEEPEGGEPGDEPGNGDDDIEIAPNKGYAEAGGQNFVFDNIEYDVTIKGGIPGAPGAEDAGKFVDWSGTTKATDAGTYFAYAKPKPGHTWPNGTTGKRQVTWTIARKPASIITKQDVVYDGLEHLGYDPAADKTNYVSITGDTNKTEAGHYIIYVTPDKNYAWLDDGTAGTREVSWTISPKPVILTWKTGPGFDVWQYDGDEHFGQCDVDQSTLAERDKGLVFPNLRDNRIIEVGKIQAKVTSLNNPNYALPTQGTTHPLEVFGAAVSTVTMKETNNGVESLIYNGQEQTGLAFSEGVSITGTSHAIDAGQYTLIATPLPGYAWDAAGNDKAPRPFDWEILQKEVVVDWGDREWDYDGIVHSTTCDIINLIPDTMCEVEISNNAILDAGTQDVTATLTNKNYKFPENPTDPEQSPNQTLKVNPLHDATFVVNEPVIYDGQTHNWGTGSHIQITGVLSETEAGIYQITIKPTPNHTWDNGTTDPVTKTWEIKHAELSMVFWDNYCYTGEMIVGVTNRYCDWGEGTYQAREQKTYTVEVTPSKNYAWAQQDGFVYKPQDRDTRIITWKIVGNTVVKPDYENALLNFGDPITSFEYNGQIWSPLVSTIDGTLPLTDAVFQKNPYYEVLGQPDAINVGKYQAIIRLKDPEHSQWSSGGTDDIIINWEITKRKITLYTLPHAGDQTYYENDAFDGDNASITVPTAYVKPQYNGTNFSGTLKLKVASSPRSSDGDIWLTKDEFPKYEFDYREPIHETTPLSAGHKISFVCDISPNLINDEVDDYSPNFDPVTGANLAKPNTPTCGEQVNAGIYYYRVIPTIRDKDNRDVTSNYEITYEFCYLMIHKANKGYELKLVDNTVAYNGKFQDLVKIVEAPEAGDIEFLWEGITYKASSSYGTNAVLKGKTSLLPNANTGFAANAAGTSVSLPRPNGISNLVSSINVNSLNPQGSSYKGWTKVIPTAKTQSSGTAFSDIGTPAGEYVVYYRVRGDANHCDSWNANMRIRVTVPQAEQTITITQTINKCHRNVWGTAKTLTQEKPVVTYSTDGMVGDYRNATTTVTGTNVKAHTHATGSEHTVEARTNGSIGTGYLTIYTAATANYKAASAKIKVYCSPHLSSGLRDSLNHLSSRVEPKCKVDGNLHYVCLECGASKDVPIPQLGHNFSTSISASGSSCLSSKVTGTSTCGNSGCGATATKTKSSAQSHRYGSWSDFNSLLHKRTCQNSYISGGVGTYDSEGKITAISATYGKICGSPEYNSHNSSSVGGKISGTCCLKSKSCSVCGHGMGSTGSRNCCHAGHNKIRWGQWLKVHCLCCGANCCGKEYSPSASTAGGSPA